MCAPAYRLNKTSSSKKTRSILLTLLLWASPFAARPQQIERAHRTLTGTVSDPHHEPLRGAVVKLQVGDTPTITTYITGTDGRYIFKRLDGNIDYRVWVTFRERTSKANEISKFDNNLNKVINFSIETF